jgi:hypothetical protein
MKLAVKSCLLLSFSLLVMRYAISGAQVFALPNAYAHNDYWHKRPLYDALQNGFTYLEADVFLHKDRLIVAHINPFFRRHRTLEKLYLQPMARYIANRRQQAPTGMDSLVLMIDIKSDGEKTFRALEAVLEKYRHLLSSCENGQQVKRNITIVLTGHRPLAMLQQKQCRLFYVDENLHMVNSDAAFADMYATASCRYGSLLQWDGKGAMPEADRKRLCALTAKAHLFGKKVRLWASPERETVWQELLRCGVDLINTNKLTALRQFFTTNTAALAGIHYD